MEEFKDLAFSSFSADSSSTASFFLTASEPAKETEGVLETKEEVFLAEEGLPCSLDSNWRKLSGLKIKKVKTHLIVDCKHKQKPGTSALVVQSQVDQSLLRVKHGHL